MYKKIIILIILIFTGILSYFYYNRIYIPNQIVREFQIQLANEDADLMWQYQKSLEGEKEFLRRIEKLNENFDNFFNKKPPEKKQHLWNSI